MTSELDALVDGVTAGDRTLLGRALTLIESSRADHRETAAELLQRLAPRTGGAIRIGISGLPGAGKSTLLDSLGTWLADERDRRVAVLAVDPSSQRSGGSILGDKTRMSNLSQHPRAFVRPSPAGDSLGGVAARTRESIAVLEAAGFDVIFVETVGVGQSEAAVASMVDTFVVLLVPGTGDELQGIKRGILELVDLLVINKADGESMAAAERARRDYAVALALLRSDESRGRPNVLTASGLNGSGVPELWEAIIAHREQLRETGELELRRREQRVAWMWTLVEEELLARARARVRGRADLDRLEERVAAGVVRPTTAAREILATVDGKGD